MYTELTRYGNIFSYSNIPQYVTVQEYASIMVNTMAADGWATQEARTSAAMMFVSDKNYVLSSTTLTLNFSVFL